MRIIIYYKKNEKVIDNINNQAKAVKFNKKKPIIIIPKKNVKLANKRNRIRRQIRSIVQKNIATSDKKLVIKYLDKNIPNFQDLKNAILTNI